MSTADPFQDLVTALRRTLTSTSTPAPPASTSAFHAASSSPSVIASPIAKQAPFSGSAEDCNGFILQYSWDSSLGERLCNLKQGALSVSDYALQFRTLVAASGWNEQALISRYRQGLDPRMRLHLAAYEDTIGLEKFIQLSIRFATRMQLCIEEHQSQRLFPSFLRQPESVSSPEPASPEMQIDRSRLSPAERQRRLTQRLCLYCGHPGHFRAECPTRPVRSMSMPSSTLGQLEI